MKCYDVEALQLLYPTPAKDIPSSNDISSESFFNFEVKWPKALINGVQFKLPVIPVVENKEHKEECTYPVIRNPPNSCEHPCTHVRYLDSYKTTARFVLSSIVQGNQGLPIYTHPIHMHGHTYFIAKIGYPEYNKDGTIKASNENLTVPSCGPAKWRDGIPEGISVNSTTVRKDVIIIPAGGYVVIHFITDNPGYWFMHCHIDEHLNRGMAIAIGENPECASIPPRALYNETDQFCFSVKTFIQKETESNGRCRLTTFSSGHMSLMSKTSLFVQLVFLKFAFTVFHLIEN